MKTTFVPKFFLGEVVDVAEFAIGAGDVAVIAGAEFASLRRVDVGGRELDGGGIVGGVGGPGNVRGMGADEKAEGFGGIAAREVGGDFFDGVAFVVMIEGVFGIVIVMRDFAEAGDLVTGIAEIGGKLFDFGAGLGMIGLGAIAGGVEASQERGSARRATRRSHKCVSKGEAAFCEAAHARRADILRAVRFGIELAEIVGDEDDDGWRRGIACCV